MSELLHNIYSLFIPTMMSPTYREQFEIVYDLYKKLAEAPTPELVKAYVNAQGELDSIEIEEAFLSGFQTGIQLFLDLFPRA